MKTTTNKLVISIVALLMLLNVAKAQQLRVLCTAVVMSEPVPASIITQPTDTSVCAGSNAMFFISAIGDEPILYQWQKNGVDILGAVNDTLLLTSILATDTGQYRCIVNNSCGDDTSGVANLYVDRSIQFSLTDTTVMENIGTANIEIILSSVDFVNTTSIFYSIVGGTATGAGTDYILTAGVATIPAGNISSIISVPIIEDIIPECIETLIIEISNPTNACLGTNNLHTLYIDEIVNIPDANFKAALVANALVNTNADSEIQCSEASAYSGKLNLESMSISDLTGIEAFTSLKTLFCNINSLTSLNLSANTALDTLVCNNNQLTTLDLTSCASLKYVYCAINNLASINVSANITLDYLNCAFNSLTSLDVSNNLILTYLSCGYNSLTSLNAKNGNNVNFSSFLATSNPALTCIQVDNAAWSTANWTNIDVGASFSENCNAVSSSCSTCDVNVPELIFDLSTQADTEYVYSSSVNRNGYCCGTVGANKCIRFTITPNPLAKYLIFSVNSPAPTGGSYYSLECSSPILLGDTVNIEGMTSFCIVYCNAGGDLPNYVIRTLSDITPFVSVINKFNISCFGANDGEASINVTGGVPPYSYNWSSGSNIDTTTGLTSGWQFVTVTDVINSILIDSVEITEPSQLFAVTTVQTNESCFGANDGSVDGSGMGGVSPYTFAWSTGGSSTSLSNLAAGTYQLTVTDANACNASTTFGIFGASEIILSPSSVQATCGNADGSATIIPSGGVTPYSYLWSNSAITQSINGITAGTYNVTVTDANGCSTSSTVNVSNIGAPSVSIDYQTNVSCYGGNNGSAALIIFGTGPYTHLWSDGQTIQDAVNLTAGVYTVTVTDANTCIGITNVTITEPTQLAISKVVANVSCAGFASGSIDITPSGGFGTYTYSWSNTSTFQDVSSLAAGVYTLTLTDGNACSIIDVTTITAPASALTLGFNLTNISCYGANDGSISPLVSGGTTPYSYLWSNSATTVTISGLAVGTYSLTVTDANGCIKSSMTNTYDPPQIFANAGTDQNICSGGSANLSASAFGGYSPYSYSWSPSASLNNPNIQNPISITTVNEMYVVTVTDNTSCSVSDTVYVNVTPAITVDAGVDQTVSTSNVNLNGIVSGGTTTGVWSTNGTGTFNPDATTLSAVYVLSSADMATGTVTLTLTSSNNGACNPVADNFVITYNVSSLSVTTSQYNSTCNGSCDGSISVSPSGGNSPYSYYWSNSFVTSSITGLCAGIYNVTVTDASSATATASVTITQPDSMYVLPTVVNSTCGNSNASIYSIVTGGSSPYTYLWSNGSTTQNISNIIADNYILSVTDNNGCSIYENIAVNDSAGPSIISMPILNNISCNASCDGVVEAVIVGGSSPFTFLWSNGQSSSINTNLCSGIYSVTVTDSNSPACSATQSITITQPSQISASTSTTDVLCYGSSTGSATVMASGGTTPYTYLWNNAATNQSISALVANGYNVTITDANGCIATSSATINQPPYLSMMISSLTAETGAGNCDGAMSVYTSGGTSPFTYLWNPSVSTSDVATGLCAGDYYITVTDVNGCTATINDTVTTNASLAPVADFAANTTTICGSGSVSFTDISTGNPTTWNWDFGNGNTSTLQNPTTFYVTPGVYTVSLSVINTYGSDVMTKTNYITVAPSPAVIVTTTNVDCFGASTGSASATVSSGTFPYFYNWNVGGNTASLSNLVAGTYSVVVTDANGCMGNASVTVTEPDSLQASFSSQTNVDCYGASTGSAVLNVSGGTTPYSYLWSNGATTQGINSVPANSYTVTIADANSCSATAYITISEPAQIIPFAGNDTVVCGLTANTTAILNGDSGIWALNSCGVFSNDTLAETIVAVPSYGTCEFIWTVFQGVCSASDTVLISFNPESIVNAGSDQSISTSSVTLNGTVSGGTNTGYWSTLGGTGTFVPDNLSLNAVYMLSSADMLAGFVSIILRSTNTVCINQDTVNITYTQPILNVTASQSNVSCFGLSDGSIEITASGGQTPYTYLWSNGETTNTLSLIPSSTYTVTITDANSEILVKTFTITEPSELIASISSQTDVSCFGLDDGSLISSVVGGTTPYNYNWSDGQATTYAINLISGTYGLTVSDANFCESILNATITESDEILLTSSITDVSCGGTSDGAIDITVTGGVGTYTFVWSNSSNTEDLANLAVGNYSVTVIDGNLCEFTTDFNVSSGANIIVTDSVENVSCFGANDGSISLDISGGNPPYNISWSNGSTSNILSGLAPGTYSVTISDGFPCSRTITFTINQPLTDITASSVSTTVADCNYSCTGSATLTISGGTSPYSYLWSGGQTSNPAQSVCPGMNTVTITDSNGCFKQYSVQINIEPLSKIKGNIYYSGILLPVDAAIVELWKESSSNNSGKTKVGDLHNVNNGYYEFSGLPSGTYFVKAKVISQGDFPNTLSTWYDTAHQWFNATPIILACNATQNININMLQVPAMANGNTDIHGRVTTATNNKSILGEPIPGAEITLEQEPDDEPIISTSSGNDGTYDFLDIPSASYIVVVDIPGYTQFETYNITVNPSDTSINNLNFVVDTNDVGLGIYIDHTIFVPLVNGKFMEVQVFPNPFSENVNIEFTLEESANVSVDIIDAIGKNVANVCNESQSKGKHTFDFKDKLQAGIYFVKISVDSTVYVKKIVKK